MTRSLPTAPNLEHLRKQAKDLLKSHRKGNPECCEELRLLKQFREHSNDEILTSHLTLHETQLAVALDYGFPCWADLKKFVLGRNSDMSYLHIHCGDSSAESLRNSSVPGEVIVWREIYIEGQTPGNVPEDEFCRVRAEFLSSSMNLDFNGILQGMRDRYKAVREADKYDEVILWFDSCMFDQTILIHVISLCTDLDTKLSLICIDRGLGEIYPKEYPELFGNRHEISRDEIKLAERAWNAFTSDNPNEIFKIVAGDCSALPFLKDALVRHLEQLPSVFNGLNRTQNQILNVVSDGAEKLVDVFVKVSNMEPRPFMGDTSMWKCIDELASCEVPLLKLDGPGKLSDFINPDPELYDSPALKDINRWRVSITSAGQKTLAGKLDNIKLNGINRCLGGVCLNSSEPPWRWDTQRNEMIR